MKKFLLFLLLLSPVAKAQITNPAPYCSHDYDGGATQQTHYISSVQIGNFINVSGTVQQPFPHYIYYNNLPVTVVQGSMYYSTVDFDALGSSRSIYVYADWDGNGVFSVTEQIYNNTVSGSDSSEDFPFFVPFSSGLAVVRLRIILAEDNSGGVVSAVCANDIDWGETEDYDLNVTNGVGVESIDNVGNHLSVHPNPSGNNITIQLQSQNIHLISIYNLSGQKVFEKEFADVEKAELSVTELQAGIYTITLQNSEGNLSQKLFVKE